MPNARRIVFSTYVVPTQSVEMEETSIRQTEFQTSPGRTLGGKGTASINATQWGDDWTSMEHGSIQFWEDYATVNWDEVTSDWSTTGTSGDVTVGTSAIQLSDDGNDMAFLYIKNTGATISCLVSIQGTPAAKYTIVVPPGGSVHLKGNVGSGDGAPNCDNIYVKTASGNTAIEYIIAKEA